MRLLKITAFCFLLCAPFVVNAATITIFTSNLDGPQANAGAGTGSDGKGAATMTLDHDTGLFSWFVAWQGLMAPVTVAHFHGAATPTQNAGVQVSISTAGVPSIGSATLTAQQIDDLLNGLWYINVHSSAFPGGEIRGQVLALHPIPVPAAMWLFGGALLGLGGFVRRR